MQSKLNTDNIQLCVNSLNCNKLVHFTRRAFFFSEFAPDLKTEVDNCSAIANSYAKNYGITLVHFHFRKVVQQQI